MREIAIAAVLCLLLAPSPNGAFAADPGIEGDAAAGESKSAQCAACHLADGNSTNPMYPRIGGQHERYIAKQLADYKSGKRQNAIMSGIAGGLSEQDMADLGAFYATREPTEVTTDADAETLELGEQLYRGGNLAQGIPACIGCHGPAGKGNPMAAFPLLTGQHTDYTATQLQHFRSRERANDAGMMMRNVAVRLTDEEINALAHYIRGLRRAETE